MMGEINLNTVDFLTGHALLMRGYEQATRAAESSARLYEAFGQAIDDLYEITVKVEPLLWRLERPRAMFKWGSVLTLVLAGVAIWSG